MKIEIGESLILSWLRHAKGCQIAQMNWKASTKSWDLQNENLLQNLMEQSIACFNDKYNYDIFGGTSGLSQLLAQAEIDVLGINIENSGMKTYAVDVAFHEAGLNYGDKVKTVNAVIKKCIRSAMCLKGYFNAVEAEIIFATPKTTPSITKALDDILPEIQAILALNGFDYTVRLISNEAFREKILNPVIASSSLVADTPELFMRSIQLYNLFAEFHIQKPEVPDVQLSPKKISLSNLNGLEEMKIGALVRSILTEMFRNNEVSKEEITLMQTAEYSKQIFDIQYPLLKKYEPNQLRPIRYWKDTFEAYGENYYICSEWFEVSANNDRPFFMKWLALHKSLDISNDV